MGLKKKAVKLPCRDSWKSVYKMLKKFVKLKEAISRLLDESSLPRKPELHDDYWNNIQHLTEQLKPFEIGAVILSSKETFSFSMIRPVTFEIVKNFLRVKADDSTLIKNFKL